jgi:DNA-binding transcriptional ArsR family regulator
VHSLDATELAGETVLNARDRVMLALKGGPAYPTDISEATHMPLRTVKNELTRLRKRGLVEYTGEVQGQAREVRLTEDGLRAYPKTLGSPAQIGTSPILRVWRSQGRIRRCVKESISENSSECNYPPSG